jgi:hypothetical protein
MALGTKRSIATFALTLASLSLAACSDPVTDPSATTALRPSGPHMIIASTTVTTALVNPTIDNIYQSAEGHRVVIPANSICKVGVSGYGAGTWDNTCTPETLPILFTLTTTVNSAGYSNLTVQPDVRFSPSKQVMVFFKDSAAANRAGMVIKYCHAANGAVGCTDEGKTDASLTTYRDPSLGYIYRRLKHFSGYNVVFGFDGGGDGSSGGMNLAPLPMNRFSGYITTVGFAGSTH